MTAVQSLNRNQLARDAIETVLRNGLNRPVPNRWSVSPRDDHSGEPALYVYVEMPTENDIPNIEKQNRLIADMMSALETIEDERFPYLYFGPRADDVEVGDDEATVDRDADSF